MSKQGIFTLARILRPHLQKKDTCYCKAILVVVKVACAFYKLTQGASLLHYSKMFAIGKSMICLAVWDFVCAVNVELQSEISWPKGNSLLTTMANFQEWCGLHSVVGAIDGLHFHIKKPSMMPKDYFYFKTGNYSMQCRAVCDKKNCFLNILIGMPRSTNDSKVLKCSSLYRQAITSNQLFDRAFSQEGFNPYVIGDKEYPLYLWLLTPYWDLPYGRQFVRKQLHQYKVRKDRCVIENSFGIFKQSF